jgi:SAM-dependent methyltransferase
MDSTRQHRPGSAEALRAFWQALSGDYLAQNQISDESFHLGPLLPSGEELGLLPTDPRGLRCLELGCGAAQNSLALARRGALCTALDLAPAMLEAARNRAAELGLTLELIEGDFDAPPAKLAEEGNWDFIHSVWALPFSRDPQKFLQRCASWLAPGGRLLLVSAHPLAAAEWIELEDGEGLFLPDYFRPVFAPRQSLDGEHFCVPRALTPSALINAALAAGLRIDGLYEPEPLPASRLDEAPYQGAHWMQLESQIRRAPHGLVLVAGK